MASKPAAISITPADAAAISPAVQAAVYLGAALFGRPSVPSALAGTLLMSAMLDGFTLLAVPYFYSDAIVSIVLVVAIAAFDPKTIAALSFFRTPFHPREVLP